MRSKFTALTDQQKKKLFSDPIPNEEGNTKELSTTFAHFILRAEMKKTKGRKFSRGEKKVGEDYKSTATEDTQTHKTSNCIPSSFFLEGAADGVVNASLIQLCRPDGVDVVELRAQLVLRAALIDEMNMGNLGVGQRWEDPFRGEHGEPENEAQRDGHSP